VTIFLNPSPRHLVTSSPGLIVAIVALLAAASVPSTSSGQAYPTKSVRCVVPYVPGGATDVLARVIGRRLSGELGQQFVIDNRPGAGTVIGTEIVTRANPDGYTLLMTSTPLGVNPHLIAKLPYDTLKDLSSVAFIAFAPVVMVANPGVPARSPQELIAAAKGNPNGFTVATPGPGSMGHLTLELLARQTGIKLRHIPYKGAGQAIADVIAGQVNFMFDNVGPARAQIAAGRTRAIAVASLKRSAVLPDVPTFDEAGLKGFEATSWFGLFAPAKTPAGIVGKLNAVVNAAIASPELKELYARDGYDASPMTPAELDRFLRAQLDKWGRVVREAGIKLE
jgi:tripartite-type tricarboxylate transporter receptor subunit TctC